MGSWGQYSSTGRSKSQRTGGGEPATAHKHRMVGNWRPDMASLWRSIEANVLLSTPPKVLVLHLGGNDLCIDSCTKVRNNIKREMNYLRTAFAGTAIIWVDTIDRINWRSSLPRKIITSKRRRVNRFGRVCVQWASGSTSITVDI
ncbi:hypothetical protein DPMN_139272 [Dreissena polymorpha]|uniref:SGNH hydrolase-type esterase domain-containing protein n=1 Tax=Dreissena polymorpha TaxID=45954 RepID=A0A9D4JHZ9_DREPO|nr:hypothetical protein DPMN_139272 [Dreissena polymorpha]